VGYVGGPTIRENFLHLYSSDATLSSPIQHDRPGVELETQELANAADPPGTTDSLLLIGEMLSFRPSYAQGAVRT
jgi:hypothetical protein